MRLADSEKSRRRIPTRRDEAYPCHLKVAGIIHSKIFHHYVSENQGSLKRQWNYPQNAAERDLRLTPVHWLALERQRNLYQGRVAATTMLMLHRASTAGVQVYEVPVFCAPDIFSARLALVARVIL
jgi:hypothetical protein